MEINKDISKSVEKALRKRCKKIGIDPAQFITVVGNSNLWKVFIWNGNNKFAAKEIARFDLPEDKFLILKRDGSIIVSEF